MGVQAQVLACVVCDVKQEVVEHVDLASDGSVSLIVAPVQEWVLCS